MEPEDAILVRDIKPLVDELNRLAAEYDKLYKRYEGLSNDY
jgi:archaellum component FlaC